MNEGTAEHDLDNFEKAEMTSPTARKVDGDRVIYMSKPLVPPLYSYGRPVLCDFSEARLENYDNMADIQPYQYRAPEVILDMPWDEKVDIWSVGVMVRTNRILGWSRLIKCLVDVGSARERKSVQHHWRTGEQARQYLSPRAYDRLAWATSKRISREDKRWSRSKLVWWERCVPFMSFTGVLR